MGWGVGRGETGRELWAKRESTDLWPLIDVRKMHCHLLPDPCNRLCLASTNIYFLYRTCQLQVGQDWLKMGWEETITRERDTHTNRDSERERERGGRRDEKTQRGRGRQGKEENDSLRVDT